MEAIITIVGFLGAGKTTLLNHLINHFAALNWSPYVILNDYENANLDLHQFKDKVDSKQLKALTGSCICCTGIHELRNYVNGIPVRKKGITLIEANGTTDACSLMEFLGVGLNNRFLPPIQIAVVNVKLWQNREEHNSLELNQVQVSSLLVLTHIENCTKERQTEVIQNLKKVNPFAQIETLTTLQVESLPILNAIKTDVKKIEHQKSHWSSCSIDLPILPNQNSIQEICQMIPESILRVKGCSKIAKEKSYTFFERMPDGEVRKRPFNGTPITGTKLLTIGPLSEPELLKKIVKEVIKNNKHIK